MPVNTLTHTNASVSGWDSGFPCCGARNCDTQPRPTCWLARVSVTWHALAYLHARKRTPNKAVYQHHNPPPLYSVDCVYAPPFLGTVLAPHLRHSFSIPAPQQLVMCATVPGDVGRGKLVVPCTLVAARGGARGKIKGALMGGGMGVRAHAMCVPTAIVSGVYVPVGGHCMCDSWRANCTLLIQQFTHNRKTLWERTSLPTHSIQHKWACPCSCAAACFSSCVACCVFCV